MLLIYRSRSFSWKETLTSMPAKRITSQLTVSHSSGPEMRKRSDLDAKQAKEDCDMSPRSPIDIDRVSEHTKGGANKRVLPDVPMKKVSFSSSDTIPKGTQHTEETVPTIKEDQESYYDCDHDVEESEHDGLDFHEEDEHNIPTTSPITVSGAKAMATTSARNKRRRKIRWSSQVRVQEIRHINDMPELVIEAVWMSPVEYKTIKNGAKTTVLMMMAGEKFHQDDPDFCSRGLEFRTRKGNKIRAANKLKARSAVLNEQDLQRDEGFHDPEFIAMASLDVSHECREQAQKRGEKDAKAIAEYVSDVRASYC